MTAAQLSTIIIASVTGLYSLLLLGASMISLAERQKREAAILLAIALLMALAGWAAATFSYPGKNFLALLLLADIALLLWLLLKPPAGEKRDSGYRFMPARVVDERDTIFARMKLKPGTTEYNNYYTARPESRSPDDEARSLPGLLSAGGTKYHPLNFAAAEANFTLIEYMHKAIGQPVSATKTEIAAPELTRYIKKWLSTLGAHSSGITELKDYHLYTIRGRGSERGRPVDKRHRYAIAFTVKMDMRNIATAPASPVIFESSQRYLDSANMALQVAGLLKGLGYDARAHIDGDYELICPLVAHDAGLGEIGRMGLLMTPDAGPAVRIAVVTTEAPLLPDMPKPDPTLITFCRICQKCADCCPGRSIPYGEMERAGGVLRWKIDSESCYRYWCITGTDCGRCIAVCPYSHPDNIMHRMVRRVIRRSHLAAEVAYMADDILYGRKPKAR